MIRKSYRDGWLLIPQPAHAWVSGIIAQKWGNESVDKPEPHQAVALAATLHDVAWLDTDGHPPLNTKGEPLSFMEPELDDVTDMYARTVAHVSQIDLYAGILINRHVRVIYRSRETRGRDSKEAIQPLLNHLEAQETRAIEQIQAHPIYKAHVSHETLEHNYRILRACDLLSLFLFGAFAPFPIANMPLRYGKPFGEAHCKFVEENILKIEPYLFSEPELNFAISGFYIPQKIFETQAQLQEMFQKAERVVLERKIIGN